MNFLKTGIRGVQVVELYSGSAIMKLRLFCNPAVRLLENNIFLLLVYILDFVCIHLCLYTYLLIFCKYCNRQKFRIQQRHSNINNYTFFLLLKLLRYILKDKKGQNICPSHSVFILLAGCQDRTMTLFSLLGMLTLSYSITSLN